MPQPNTPSTAPIRIRFGGYQMPASIHNQAARRFGERLAARLQAAGAPWVIPPEVRHQGTVREQMTMFALDPSGNGVEFKHTPARYNSVSPAQHSVRTQ